MSGPVGQTAPTNDAFSGGTLAPASNPTAVSGTFGGPGASGFPAPGQPNILSARNNSGSNVRIPYARLVPMRGKTDGADAAKIWASIPDINLRNGLNGRQVGQEYDGLEQAELAWIMGRKHIFKSGDKAGQGNPVLAAMSSSAHGHGMGKGVDRLQRLCYQGYMEAYFRAVFGQQTINLGAIEICDDANKYLCEEIERYEPLLGGASVLGSVDVAYMSELLFGMPGVGGGPPPKLQYATRDKDWDAGTVTPDAPVDSNARGGNFGLASGIFTMDKGPFLRGKIVEDAVKHVTDPHAKGGADGTVSIKHAMSRNFGDELAFEALYAHMKAKNFFDWTPDGMVLSKLESPSGDPYSSMELDARQAQLFNIAIQGPAIAKTWTGDSKMQTMPMDRVFVAVVADVVTVVGGAGEGQGASAGELDALHKAFKAFTDSDTAGTATAFKTTLGNSKGKVAAGTESEYEKKVKELFDKTKEFAAATTAPEREAKDQELMGIRAELESYFFSGSSLDERKEWMKAFEETASALRRGDAGASRCVMTNFRMMRVTSSFLAQYSHFVPGKPETRCGLRIGTQAGAPPAAGQEVVGEYIIGAWHIGTVLDNAASRSTIGSTVRVAPASMAININVNVEWWSGDKLYRNYMDVEGQVLRRDAQSKSPEARLLGIDVSEADMVEATSWFPVKK